MNKRFEEIRNKYSATVTSKDCVVGVCAKLASLAAAIHEGLDDEIKDSIAGCIESLIISYHLRNVGNELEDQADFENMNKSDMECIGYIMMEIGGHLSMGYRLSYVSICDYLATIAANNGLTIDECLK